MSDPKDIRPPLVVWFVSGALLMAPAWLRLGPAFLALGLLGPMGLLAFKPSANPGGKLLVAILVALPAVIALAWLRSRWKHLDTRSRLLWTFAASFLWHAPGLALWLMIAASTN